MSEAKFTKGQWYVEKESGMVVSTHDKTEICEYHPTGDYEFEANANLIAAAPEMYAMLETAVGMFSGTEFASRAEKLLAKARGEV